MWCFARITLLLLLANPAAATEFCPDRNPADTEDTGEIDEQAKRQYVLCKCGARRPNGDYVLSDAESIRRYIVLINNDFLARYDENCNLEFDADEKARYIADKVRIGDKTFHDAVTNTDADTIYYQREVGRRLARAQEGVPLKDALGVLPDVKPETRKLSIGVVIESSAVQNTRNIKIGYNFFERPWRSPTTNSKLSFGFELEASRKDVETSTDDTLTRSVDFFPVNYKVTPLEDLTLSASAGVAYLLTDQLVKQTGIESNEKDTAFVYRLGATYQTILPCLSLGADYKIRTDKFATGKLSSEWSPKIVFNFLKACRPG